MKKCLRLFLTLFLTGALSFGIACAGDEDEESDEKYEPNNDRTQAFSIELDMVYNAMIGDNDDDDWFKFATAHDNSTFDKMQISVTDVSSGLYIHMELYSINGESLDSHATTTTGQDLTYTFSTPGAEYYIRFSGWDGYVNDHYSSGSYSFTVSNLDANDDFAPNHTLETAVEDLEFGVSYSGVLVSRYEDDCYKFENPVPGTWNSYTVSLTELSAGLFGAFEIYDSSKSSMVIFRDTGATTAGADVSYTIITKEDAFYVRISGWDGYVNDHVSSGNYTFTVVNNGNDDYEPDDTFEDAREITSFPSGTISGAVLTSAANNNGGDYEFFKVTLNEGKKVTFIIDPEAANTEMHFNVYGNDQSYLGQLDGEDGQTLEFYVNNTGASTSFYIKLGAYVGDNGNYTISFTETDAD